MSVLLEDAPEIISRTFFQEYSGVAKKAGAGRPSAIALTPEEFDEIVIALRESADHLADSAKFMRENELPRLTIPAAKLLDEHLPGVEAFSRKVYSEVGPALRSFRLGRKTRYWRVRVCQSRLTGGFCRNRLAIDAGTPPCR